MKKWWKALVLAAIIVVQTVIYTVAGAGKAYFHMDEIYSYGLSNHERVQIYETEGFYDSWHGGEYYDEYLTVGKDERGKLAPVYENQKNDVHPPLFYLLLRLGMEMTLGQFSKWTGIILNILISGVNTVVLWLVIRKMTTSQKKLEQKQEIRALILTAVVAWSLMAVSTVIYIRMYMLLTLWVSLTTWLHLKLMERQGSAEKGWGIYVMLGVVELLGALTQYYYWFYLAAWFMVMVVRYVRQKQWQNLGYYAGTVIGAGLVSLAIWPFAISHMFFGYRGGGVMTTLLQPLTLLANLWNYVGILDEYVFQRLLLIIVMILLLVGAVVIRKQKRLKDDEGEVMGTVLIPTLFYLTIVAAASPFAALRYVAPVCGLLMVITLWSLWRLIEGVMGERRASWVMGAGLVVFSVVMPIYAGLEPDVSYSERAAWVEKAEELQDVPGLYLMKTGDDWGILNDILLLREMKQTYVAKDVTQEREIKQILAGKDLDKGLVVWINDGQDNERVLEMVKAATGLEKIEWHERLVMSDMYYLVGKYSAKNYRVGNYSVGNYLAGNYYVGK